MIITDKDLSKIEEMLLKNLITLYCEDPGTFETDMGGDDQYNSGCVRNTIHNTIDEWAHSPANVRRRNAYIDVEEFYKE